jgi:hypothetical protein
MTSISNRAETQAEVSAERTRAFALPAIAAILIFGLIAYIQFSTFLGQYGFLAQLPLGVGFYYCWAWHTRLAKRAAKRQAQLDK